ncbi:MAG: hypothetical protein BWX99_00816 [Deltaproteobacteria bacterium ADurb.Bin151]|nr:MAG: hypothetical protein BWX99_00816 [Deltaproteobacteria bacterium ADurb.Bin151]
MTTANIKMTSVLILFALLSVFLTVAEGKASQQFLLRNGAKIEDTKTGLEWAINAGTPSFGKCNGGKKTWDEAADYVNCLNSSAYLGHNDWRLPSVHELSGFISKIAKANKIEHKYDIAGPKLKELGFKNIQPSLYWSSVATGEVALAVEISTNGRFHPVGKLNTLYVWPVRGGK